MKNLILILLISYFLIAKSFAQINVFTIDDCNTCSFVIKYFKDRGIKFRELNRNIKENNDALDKALSTCNLEGVFGLDFPVIQDGKKVYFNIENLEEFMDKTYGKTPKIVEDNDDNNNINNSNKFDLDVNLTGEEEKLYQMIMDYRAQFNLPRIPISKSLTYVAKSHAKDIMENKPDISGCNAHSWSNRGKWKGCCYTSDHKQANCMWNKPSELTNYKDDGFEIAFGSSDPMYSNFIINANSALDGWKKSFYHNQVIINQGIWKDVTWQAIGLCVTKNFACVWFGKSKDAE